METGFLFDTQGFVRGPRVSTALVWHLHANAHCLQLVLRGVLSGPELAAARAAFERTLATATVPPPGGVRDPTAGPARSNVDGKPIREPDLECMASHPKLLPIIAELCQGAPQLTAMTMVVRAAALCRRLSTFRLKRSCAQYHPPHVK